MKTHKHRAVLGLKHCDDEFDDDVMLKARRPIKGNMTAVTSRYWRLVSCASTENVSADTRYSIPVSFKP